MRSLRRTRSCPGAVVDGLARRRARRSARLAPGWAREKWVAPRSPPRHAQVPRRPGRRRSSTLLAERSGRAAGGAGAGDVHARRRCARSRRRAGPRCSGRSRPTSRPAWRELARASSTRPPRASASPADERRFTHARDARAGPARRHIAAETLAARGLGMSAREASAAGRTRGKAPFGIVSGSARYGVHEHAHALGTGLRDHGPAYRSGERVDGERMFV